MNYLSYSWERVYGDTSTKCLFRTEPQKYANKANRILTKSPKKKDVNRIYYSGEIEGETYDLRLKSGIPIDNKTAKIFANLADRFEIKQPLIKESNSWNQSQKFLNQE